MIFPYRLVGINKVVPDSYVTYVITLKYTPFGIKVSWYTNRRFGNGLGCFQAPKDAAEGVNIVGLA